MYRILFVCLGNICRSPTAEGVFRDLVQREAPDLAVEIDSAGTGTWHIGHAPDRRAQQAALKRGIDISGLRARRVEPYDFEHYDYILAMDADNLAVLQSECPPDYRAKLFRFLEFARETEAHDVPDPYYGNGDGFERVLDLVEDAARGLLQEIRRRAGRNTGA